MARLLKSILFLLLVVIMHIASDNAFTENHFSDDNSANYPYSSQQHSLDKVQLPFRADAEMGSIGFHLMNHIASFRDQRTQRGYFTLKSVWQILAEHQSLLFRHWNRVDDDALLSSITRPVSEYYIFGLRHIII